MEERKDWKLEREKYEGRYMCVCEYIYIYIYIIKKDKNMDKMSYNVISPKEPLKIQVTQTLNGFSIYMLY